MTTIDINKNVKNIIVCSIDILILVAFCWFYEPIVQTPIPHKLTGYLLSLFMILPISIIINAKSILKKLHMDTKQGQMSKPNHL